MVVTVTLNPAVDKTIEVNNFKVDHVNRVDSIRKEPGGKGINVSKTIHALGRKSKAFAVVGGETGNFIEHALEQRGLDGYFYRIDGETRTNIKMVDYANNTFTDINESGPSLKVSMNEDIQDEILSMLQEGDLLVLSGSLPIGLAKTFYRDLINKANAKGIETILDAEGEILECALEAKPTFIKPNIHELESIAGRKLVTSEEIITFAKGILAKDLVKTAILLSNGEEGSYWISCEEVKFVHPIKTNVISTVGAGDAMVAALAIGITERMTADELLAFTTATAVHRISTVDLYDDCQASIQRIMSDVQIDKIEI